MTENSSNFERRVACPDCNAKKGNACPTRVAILGWGSLLKEPRDLPIVGKWQPDGPKLSIEFSRISRKGKRGGCLTLVIDERCESEVTTFYVLSKRNDLSQAIADLQMREGTSADDIGFCEVATGQFAPNAMSRHPKSCERILAWAREKKLDAVIWAALPRRFQGRDRHSIHSGSCVEISKRTPCADKNAGARLHPFRARTNDDAISSVAPRAGRT